MNASLWVPVVLVLASEAGSPAAICGQEHKTEQSTSVEGAKRFVGTCRGKPQPEAIIDNVLVFKMEGNQLKGMMRNYEVERESDGQPRITRDEMVPLPDLSVDGGTVSWKKGTSESVRKVTLISYDEILFEFVGISRSNGQETRVPVSYRLKREK